LLIFVFKLHRGHEFKSNIRKDAAFKSRSSDDPVTPGDELDVAGDEILLAFEDYHRAAKHWKKAVNAFGTVSKLELAKTASENAPVAWQGARRTLLEAIEIHSMAHDQYQTKGNLTKRTAVLGKMARNLELLVEMR
jgi:hypothetical protein